MAPFDTQSRRVPWPIYPLLAACVPLTHQDAAAIPLSQAAYVSVPFFRGDSRYSRSPMLDERAQLRILEQFASDVVSQIVSPPQAAVDVVNERFWELI